MKCSDGILTLGSAHCQPALRLPVAQGEHKLSSLCAQRSCTPLSKRGGINRQNVRWAHRAEPCTP
jgi:hypothetical protein